MMMYLLAELLLDVGRWDEADEILEGVAARGVSGVPAMFTHAYRARLCGDAWPLVHGGSMRRPRGGVVGGAAAAADPAFDRRCARAESCLWSGDVEEAMADADQAGAITSDPMEGGGQDDPHARRRRPSRARPRARPAGRGPADGHRR